MSRTRKVRVRVKDYLAPTEIRATFVNPGEWFSKRWLVGVGVGFSCLFYIVEAGNEQDALDALVDSDWGHIVKTECEHEMNAEGWSDDCTHAGDYGEHVDFDAICVLKRLT